MNMLPTLDERIREKYQTLSKGQQDVARFILNEPKLVALYPAKQIGELTGTSETTVIRLCYSLNYSGYSEMQNDVRKSLLFSRPETDPLMQYHTTTGDMIRDPDHVRGAMRQDLMNVQETLEQLDMDAFDGAADAVTSARRVFIAGTRFSFAAAYWLWYTLNSMLGNVTFYRGETDDAVQLLTDIDKDCVLLAVSFPRYHEETVAFARAAKSRGSSVIAITDSKISPVGLVADICLLASQPSVFKGMAATFSLLNAFVTHVAAKDWKRMQNRLLVYDEMWDLWLEQRKGAQNDSTGGNRN